MCDHQWWADVQGSPVSIGVVTALCWTALVFNLGSAKQLVVCRELSNGLDGRSLVWRRSGEFKLQNSRAVIFALVLHCQAEGHSNIS